MNTIFTNAVQNLIDQGEIAVLDAQKKFKLTQDEADIMYALASSLSYHNPNPQIHTIRIGTGFKYSTKFNEVSLEDLFDKGIGYTYTNNGCFKESIPINPLTNRKLQIYYPCMVRKFFDNNKDVMYYIHSKMGDCHMDKADWIAFMEREYDTHYGYTHMVRDTITHKGITGMLGKETRCQYNIIAKDGGVHRLRK